MENIKFSSLTLLVGKRVKSHPISPTSSIHTTTSAIILLTQTKVVPIPVLYTNNCTFCNKTVAENHIVESVYVEEDDDEGHQTSMNDNKSKLSFSKYLILLSII